jgi:Zn-dependent protease
MVFSFTEIFDMAIMSLVVGFIFSGIFSQIKSRDVLDQYLKPMSGLFDWEAIKRAIIVIAPAIILHEFGHKFVAMAFGLSAQFNAAYGWLAFGAILKIIGSPFLFFVPAYVSFPAIATPLQSVLIGVAGPAVNGLLYLFSKYMVHRKQKISQTRHLMWVLSAKINGFLCIFNLIPIPGFDGFHVFYNLTKIIFGI